MAKDSAQRDVVRWADVLSEFVGTFTLIFIGVGAVVATQGSDLLAIAIAHGFALVVMISAIGHVSGGHLNPAVTFGAWVTQKISGTRALIYWATQLVAGVLGALAIKWLLPKAQWDAAGVKLGTAKLGTGITSFEGIVIEAILTFFLVWVVFATAIDDKGAFAKIAGLAIGATVMIDILMGGPYTGAAMNPARAFGPALAIWDWKDFYVWIIGPLAGGAAAAFAYDRIILRTRDDA